jgi:hypothetical protein
VTDASLPACSGRANDNFTFQPSRPGYGTGLTKPNVTDADLSLFAAPPVPVKVQPPRPGPSPAHTDGGWGTPSPAVTPTASAAPTDNWGDDFGISWDERKSPMSVSVPRTETHDVHRL